MPKVPVVISGRVTDGEAARIDAAARLSGVPRAHFVVEAAMERATEVLRDAVAHRSREEMGPVGR